jgi:hypothetical protein
LGGNENPFAMAVLAAKTSKQIVSFDKQIDKITNKKNTMGLIEQITKMRVQEAEERTNEANHKKFVTYLLMNTSHSLNEIASIVNVSVSFVEKVKEELHAKQCW